MIEFLKTNWPLITGIFAALIALGTAVVKITPTDSDNKWWDKWILGTLGRLGFLNTDGSLKIPGPHPNK